VDKRGVHGANLPSGINFADMVTYLKRFILCCPFALLLFLGACLPKENIVFLGVKNINIEPDEKGDPILMAEALFHNPNRVKMKLKEIHVDVIVDGKLSAQVNQQLTLTIAAKSDFSVALIAQLSLKELGLLDTIVNLLGGKKYNLEYLGYVRVAVHGVTVKVPISYKEEVRLRL
jgi:LEA14-like dessication related protein